MTIKIFLSILFILLLFTLNLKFTFKIIKYKGFSTNQKSINITLIWLIPLIWYYLIKDIIKDPITNTIENRKVSTYQNHETGYPTDY